ncbi:MAG: ABC transporter permease [Bacteroidia bacterium]
MNTSLFIAKRIIFNGAQKSRISRPIVKIAVWGIALGMAVMIATLAVVNGFQKEIRDKVVGFGSHIQITNYDTNNSLEPSPFRKDPVLLKLLSQLPGVGHIQGYALKAGIIHGQDEMLGVVLKGVGTDFNWDFFKRNIKQGDALTLSDTGLSNKILISSFMAAKLKLKVGDKTRMYFIQDKQQRQRAFRIAGIYETGLEGFDNFMVFADIAHVRKLNNWDTTSLAGFEVLLKDFRTMDNVSEVMNDLLVREHTASFPNGDSLEVPSLQAKTIRELNPQIFNWLDFTDKNAAIIISLMLFVAVINMTSALLILILERTHLIGILKALGAADAQVRRIFLFHSVWLIGQGLLIGNIIGIGLSLFQQHTHLLKLDQDSYYVAFVPVNLDLASLLSLNALTIAICLLVLLIPALIISRITPLKAIRFS